MYINFVFLLWGSKLKTQVFQKSPFDGLLLKNRNYGNCLHAIPLQKNCKKYWQASQDNNAKTVVELVWHSAFCTALVV